MICVFIGTIFIICSFKPKHYSKLTCLIKIIYISTINHIISTIKPKSIIRWRMIFLRAMKCRQCYLSYNFRQYQKKDEEYLKQY